MKEFKEVPMLHTSADTPKEGLHVGHKWSMLNTKYCDKGQLSCHIYSDDLRDWSRSEENTWELQASRPNTRGLGGGHHNGAEEKVKIWEMFSSENHQAFMVKGKWKKKETEEVSQLSDVQGRSLTQCPKLVLSPQPCPTSLPLLLFPGACMSQLCRSQRDLVALRLRGSFYQRLVDASQLNKECSDLTMRRPTLG